MANLPETSNFDSGVYQLETTDAVQGGASGVVNTPFKNLVNRSRWLYDQIALLAAGSLLAAPLNSPTFTGSPRVPAPPVGDNSTRVPNTAWVQANVGTQAVTVDCTGGSNVVLDATHWGCGIINLIGAITANINVILPSFGVGNTKWTVYNGTTGAFTVTFKCASGSGVPVKQGRFNLVMVLSDNNTYRQYNDFDNISITGNSTAVTQPTSDISTLLATTAHVQSRGMRTSGQQTISTSTTLTEGVAGATLLVGNSGQVITFNSLQTTYWLANVGTFDVTLSFPTGTDFRSVLHPGEKVVLSGDGNGFWRLMAAANLRTAVTQTAGDNSTNIATTAYTDSAVSAALTSISSPGDTKMTFAATAPAGWLMCDGSAVSRTANAALFAAIGTRSGVGDGSTTFNLPDMRGMFPRGFDSSGAIDPGRTLGSFQADSFETHTHLNGVAASAGSENPMIYATSTTDVPGTASKRSAPSNTGINIQGTTSATGGTETRPMNIALNFVIKT